MQKEIININSRSSAKMFCIMYFVVGVFAMLLEAGIATIHHAKSDQADWWQGILVFALYPLAGWITGALLADVYNFAVKFVGGIRVTLSETGSE